MFHSHIAKWNEIWDKEKHLPVCPHAQRENDPCNWYLNIFETIDLPETQAKCLQCISWPQVVSKTRKATTVPWMWCRISWTPYTRFLNVSSLIGEFSDITIHRQCVVNMFFFQVIDVWKRLEWNRNRQWVLPCQEQQAPAGEAAGPQHDGGDVWAGDYAIKCLST